MKTKQNILDWKYTVACKNWIKKNETIINEWLVEEKQSIIKGMERDGLTFDQYVYGETDEMTWTFDEYDYVRYTSEISHLFECRYSYRWCVDCKLCEETANTLTWHVVEKHTDMLRELKKELK